MVVIVLVVMNKIIELFIRVLYTWVLTTIGLSVSAK